MNTSRFWDRIAPKYAATPIKDVESYEHKLRATSEHLTPNSEVLEFGCGTGGTALYHARNVRHVTAVDISGQMIKIAKRQALQQSVTNVRFSQGDLLNVDRPGGHFDAILGLSVMHLIEDRQPVLERVHQLLRPGGVFITNTVCIAESAAWLKYLAPIGRAVGLLPTLAIFRQDAWLNELKNSGFNIEYTFEPKGGRGTCFVIARR